MSNEVFQKAVDVAAKGNQTQMARMLGVKQGHVWMWINRTQKFPAEWCAAVEQVTEGKVTKQDLRPDLFGAPAHRTRARA